MVSRAEVLFSAAKKDPLGLRAVLSPATSPLLLLLVFVVLWVAPYGIEGPGDYFTAMQGSTVLSAVYGAIALGLHLFCGRQYSAVFIQAAAIRLAVLGVFYLVAPESFTFPLFNINTSTMPIWDDDVHYVGAGQYIVDFGVPAGEVVFENPTLPFALKVAHVGLLISWIKLIFGEAQVWVRLVHVLLGSVTALVVLLSLRRLVGPASQRFGALLVVFGPEFIQSSILLYKEVYVHLSTAILLYGLWQVAQDREIRPRSAATALVGLACIWWCRQEVFLLSLGVTAVHFFVFTWKGGAQYGSRIALGIVATVVIMSIFNFGPKKDMMESVLQDTTLQQGASFGWAAGLTGPARLFHLPLSFANPPPFLLHQYVAWDLKDYSWFKDVFRELRTVQWWWMAPWIAFGLVAVWDRKSRLATFVLPYICVWFSAAIAFNGVGPEVVRYRDTFLASAVMLAMIGHEFAGRRFQKITTPLTLMTIFAIWLFMNAR